jgi:hypothetical protein
MGESCQIHTRPLLHPGRVSSVPFELQVFDPPSWSLDFEGGNIMLFLLGIEPRLFEIHQ